MEVVKIKNTKYTDKKGNVKQVLLAHDIHDDGSELLNQAMSKNDDTSISTSEGGDDSKHD